MPQPPTTWPSAWLLVTGLLELSIHVLVLVFLLSQYIRCDQLANLLIIDNTYTYVYYGLMHAMTSPL
jgi:hypothetical protein